MKELYFGALDLSPYLESITNGYILNLRDVPNGIKKEMELSIRQGASFFCVCGSWNKIGRLWVIQNKKPNYWLFLGVGESNHSQMAFQFLKSEL